MLKRTLTVAVFIGFLLLAGALFVKRVPSSPEQAMNTFLNGNVTEDQIMDPLILKGEEVLPILHQIVRDPQMKRRRYAIGAMGNIGSEASLPILKSIYLSNNEVSYIRCDAFLSIVMISDNRAHEVMNNGFEEYDECFRKAHYALDALPSKDALYMERSYIDALFGVHN